VTEVDLDGMQANKAAAEEGWMSPLPPEQGGLTPPVEDAPPAEPEPVELDPEAAEHRLSHAAQEVVDLAVALIRNAKSDIFVRKEDMANLRKAVNELDLAYAETVTIGKILGLAEQVESQPALGDNKSDVKPE
jgi:hypothetical protein